EPRAALGLRSEACEPLAAPVDDVRQRSERLHVVDDRRLAERALDRRKRRLDLGPAFLALERREQAGLLTADVGAGAPVYDDVEIEPGALDVLAAEPRLVRLAERLTEDAPWPHVLAADVDEPPIG